MLARDKKLLHVVPLAAYATEIVDLLLSEWLRPSAQLYSCCGDHLSLTHILGNL